MVLSEVECLMMVFGLGAINVCNDVRLTSAETTRSPQPPSRRGHHERRGGGSLADWDLSGYATASFRPTATLAFFMPIRFDKRVPHAFNEDHFFVRCMRTLAAS